MTIVKRLVKGSALTHAELDGNFTDLDGRVTALGSGGGSAITVQDEGSSLATAATTINFVGGGVTASGTGAVKTITIPGESSPIVLTVSTGLTTATHANRRLEVNSATAVNIDMPASPNTGDKYYGINLGAGLITLRTSVGGALTGNALLPATIDQYSPFEVWNTATGLIRVV
jgi:hypothetical protein